MPTMVVNEYLAQDILTWRRLIPSNRSSKEGIDFLLDLEAGLSSQELITLSLNPQKLIRLKKPLEELEKLWDLHVNENIPLQYLVGRCYWRDMELEVNSDVLIPRQETELLVDIALEKFHPNVQGFWVDLGTGSGALAIALARSLPSWQGHAVDCSQTALSLAKKNLERLSPYSKVKFHLGSWWEPLKSLNDSINLILSNPPYIPTSTFKQLESIVLNNEPKIALWGGEDGMDACRELVSGAMQALSSGGWLIFEHHHDKSDQALELLDKHGFDDVSFRNDFQGVKRFAMGRHP